MFLQISKTANNFYTQKRDLHVAQREEDIGFYAGFLGKTCCHKVSLSNKNHAYILLYFFLENYYISSFSLGASYMIGRGIASVFWGIIADRIGRKPVIAFSVFSV